MSDNPTQSALANPALLHPPVGLTKKADRKKVKSGRHDAITHLLSTVSLGRDGYSFNNGGKK